MSSSFQIQGYAIVSADGMIADADGDMPESLKHEADHQFFAEALDGVDLVAHGRHSHEGQPKSDLRRRFWITRSVETLTPRAGVERQWDWNPQGLALEDACRSIGLTRGTIAILGGPSAYSQFLPVYQSFFLSRATRARIPGGTPVFTEIGDGLTVEQVLRRNGLEPEPTMDLDAASGVTVTRWVRH